MTNQKGLGGAAVDEYRGLVCLDDAGDPVEPYRGRPTKRGAVITITLVLFLRNARLASSLRHQQSQ